MKINRIKIENFKSYASCDLDLSKVTACSVVGANGAGKSTLTESILWVLFGYSKSMTSKDLIHPGADYIKIDLWMTVDDHDYFVSRKYHDGSYDVEVQADGAPLTDYSSGMLPALIKIIGATRELIAESVIIQQGQLSSFITATSAERRDLIMSMLGMTKYERAWAMAKDSVKTMVTTMESHDQSVGTLRRQMNQLPASDVVDLAIQTVGTEAVQLSEKITGLITKREQLLAQDAQARTALAEYNRQVEDLKLKVVQVSNKFDNDIARLRKLVDEADKLEASRPQLVLTLDELDKTLKEAYAIKDTIDKVHADISVHVSKADAQRAKINIISTNAEVCPLCGTGVTPEKWQQIMNQMQSELQDTVSTMSSLHASLATIPKPGSPQKLSGEIEEIRNRIARVDAMIDTRTMLIEQVNKLSADKEQSLAETKQQLERISATTVELQGKVNIEVDIISTEIDLLQTKHMSLSRQLSEWTANKRSREMLEHSIEDVSTMLQTAKNTLPEIKFIEGALSPTGIPLILIDFYLPLIQNRAKELLYIMSDGQLDLKLLVQDGKKVELLAGCGQLRSVKSLSGGEQTRVSLAIRLALSQVLFDMTGCKFDCLIIDEPEYLDSTGVSQFVNAISNLRSIFSQIFVISHLPEIRNAFPQHIMVTKHGNMSTADLRV